VTCPRCAAVAAASQEYCLQCGLRLPGSGRFGYVPLKERRVAVPLLLTLVAAAGGAVAAIAATRDETAPAPAITALGGNVTVPRAAAGPVLATWPANTDGWTIVLQSLPKRGRGKATATAIASAARKRGLPQVGIIDSGRFASLHPGYWTVFTGVYETQPDANGVLQQARTVVKTAHVQRIAR
jgi:hypothetical protein